MFCWLKLLLVDFFLWYPFQFNSYDPDTTGGSSRHELKSFWSINLFLEDLKKFYIFIFWRVRYAYSSSQVLLMLYLLLTTIFTFCRFSFSQIPMLFVCSWYYGGFFSTWIETFWFLEPFLRRPQKIFNFPFLTCPISIFDKAKVTNGIYFVDQNFYVFCISFSKNPNTIRMFLKLRWVLFDIDWTHFFPETFS